MRNLSEKLEDEAGGEKYVPIYFLFSLSFFINIRARKYNNNNISIVTTIKHLYVILYELIIYFFFFFTEQVYVCTRVYVAPKNVIGVGAYYYNTFSDIR